MVLPPLGCCEWYCHEHLGGLLASLLVWFICFILFWICLFVSVFVLRRSVPMQSRLVLNSWASCLCLPDAEVSPPKAWLMDKFLCEYLFFSSSRIVGSHGGCVSNFGMCMYMCMLYVYVCAVCVYLCVVGMHMKSRHHCQGCPSVT